MQKKTFKIFFGNNADIQEIEKHLSRSNDDRSSNEGKTQKTFHRHRHRNR